MANIKAQHIMGIAKYRFKISLWQKQIAPNAKAFGTNKNQFYKAAMKEILDPFIGSGTTAIACITNRNYIGFEMTPIITKSQERIRKRKLDKLWRHKTMEIKDLAFVVEV